jgi:septal ring factor EnvC (AmiA/AmiB activator)
MTNEEMHRTMEFIVEQQAQFAANIQRLQDERVRDNPRLTRLEESFQLLVQLAQTTDARLDRLESTTFVLESTTSTLESNMAALAAAQTHTDERLSALIDIVREGRNGKSS